MDLKELVTFYFCARVVSCYFLRPINMCLSELSC